ncbi:MAG TPA: DUF5132 domain-containing protein [Desulfomonilaceae bacterium]|nr:DUF5132 domain-containing protein [Desulfomonilaceae bacterium]
MARWTPKGGIWTAAIIGAGFLLAPVVIPVVAAAARPILKAAIKGGILLYDKASEMVAEATEVTEDLVAEAKAEIQAEIEAVKRETS